MGTTTAALARLLVGQGEEIREIVRTAHHEVSDVVFRALGPLGAPVQPVHDAVTDGLHALLSRSLGAVATAGGAAAGSLVDDDRFLASDIGDATVGAVLGLIGDTVTAREPALLRPTALLHEGATVAAVGAPAPSSRVTTPTVVVLVHGLCETDRSWGWGSGPDRPSLPARVAGPDRTVLLARVNSGRRPADVGAELAALLADVVGPSVERVVLVGHSMGGLFCRAAVRAGDRRGLSWVDRCDTLVTIGTPHNGAPLEQAVAAVVAAGAAAPVARAITGWLEQRSSGVRDLRHGVTTDERPPGARVAARPLPPHVVLHTIGAALGPPTMGAAFGDGLVMPRSAHAVASRLTRRGGLDAARGPALHLDDRSHFALLCDPEVGAHVAALCDGTAPPVSPPVRPPASA